MEVFNIENITKKFISNVLKKHGVNTAYDEDGDISIEKDFTIYITIRKEKSFMSIFSNFEENKEKTKEEILEQLNDISLSYPISAMMNSDGGILFKHIIFYGGGMTEDGFIESIDNFSSIINEIAEDNEYSVFG